MNRFVKTAPVIVILIFAFYATTTMTYAFTQEVGNVSRTSILELLVVGISIYSVFSIHSFKSNFYNYWVMWMIWMVIIFVIGLGGSGLANIIHVFFCPMSFILFYNCSTKSQDASKVLIASAVVLFLMASFRHISISNMMTEILAADIYASSNHVYWPLCCAPFLFLVDKKTLKYSLLFLLIIDIIISQKRAHLFAVSTIMLVFVFWETKKTKLSTKILLIISVVVGFYIMSRLYSGYVDQLIGRVNNLSEDEGSGRVKLWSDVFNSLSGFDFADWILGRGYGSIKLSGHSNAHNDGLQMLYEYGLFGLVFYLVMIILFIRRTIILYRRKSKYFLGYFSALTILLFLGAVSNITVSNNYFAFICAYAGFVEAQIKVRKDYHSLLIKS